MRGSTSQEVYAKKGYSIELRNADSTDRSESLLGMPKESDWALIGPYNDKTLIRDALAYHTARQIMPYAPRAQHVELVRNGNYRGVYLLAEKIKRDKDRVAIEKNETDITGGYIIKMDKFTGATNDSWQSQYKPTGATFQVTDFLYHYPEADDITTAQKTYIKNWFDDFEDALAGPNYRDTLTGYRKYINVETFIDYMLINEAFRNVDAYRLSTYCYKNRDSIDEKLSMGPVWDFNIAMGLGDYCSAQRTDGWAWDMHRFCADDAWLVPFWWARLRSDPAYMRATHNRWKELRAGAFATSRIYQVIDSMALQLEESQVRNFQRWPVMGMYVWPNAFVGNSFSEEIDYLKTWLRDRFTWMDGELLRLSDSTQFDPFAKWEPEVFPNPAMGGQYFTKINARQYDRIRVRVTAADGRVVQLVSSLAPSSGEQTLTWPQLLVAQGVYFWEIDINNEKKGSGKLVVID